MRRRWIYENGVPVEVTEMHVKTGPARLQIMPDIAPYKSMVTGETITSRSKHREHLKRHSLIEIGNEVTAHMSQRPRGFDREKRKRDIANVINSKY